MVAERYRLLRLIGAGGMGAVYEAEHLRLGTRVALKTILNRAARDPDTFERFRREARSIADLHHPGIVEVRDLGTDESGFPFMALELLEGGSAWDLLEGGPLPVERAVCICQQALDALAVAHARGIVHRDLKPANLFVAQVRGGGEHVKILDFGLAKVLEADMMAMTRTGHMMGSVPYMSPEQAADAKRVDVRTDVYAMGATLFELLTARLPVEGQSAIEILLRVGAGQIRRTPSQLRSEVPKWLDAVTARALARDPSARFQTAAEMKAALEQGGTTTAARAGEATTRATPAAYANGSPSAPRTVPPTAQEAASPLMPTASTQPAPRAIGARAPEPRRRVAPRAIWLMAAAAATVAVIVIFVAMAPPGPIGGPTGAPVALPQPAAGSAASPSAPRPPSTWERPATSAQPALQPPVAPVSGPGVQEHSLQPVTGTARTAPAGDSHRTPRPVSASPNPAPRQPPPVPGSSAIAQRDDARPPPAPAPAPAAPPSPPPDPAAGGSDVPSQPSVVDWDANFRPLAPRVMECTRGGRIMVEICARGEGRVTSVRMVTRDVPPEAEDCVARAIRTAQVRRFVSGHFCSLYSWP